MSEDELVCQVCLRTDGKLGYVERRLIIFHAKLVETPIKCQDRQFCFECEHLLRRFYNFRNKCRKGQEILTDCKRSMIKLPLDVMSTLLPSSLGMWSPHSVINITYDESTPTLEPKLEVSPDLIIRKKSDTELNSNEVHNSIEMTTEPKRKVVMPIQVPMYQLNNESVPSIEMGNVGTAADAIDNPHIPINIRNEQQSVETDLEYNRFPDYEPNNTDNEDNDDYVSQHVEDTADLDLEYLEMASINSDDIDKLNEVLNDSHDEGKLDKEIKEDIKNNDKNISDAVNEKISNEERELSDCESIQMHKNQYRNKDTTSELDDCVNKDVMNYDSDNGSAADENDDLDDPDMIKIDTITAKLKDVGEKFNDTFNNHEKIIPDLSKVTLKKTLKSLPVQVKSIMQNINFVLNCYRNALKVRNIKNMSTKEYVTYVMMTTIDKLDASTRGGTGVDKEFVRQCLEDKVPPSLRQLLLRVINKKSFISNSVMYTLLKKARQIEKRYKDVRWEKVSEVFQIEYLNSEEKVLEEFKSRKNYKTYSHKKIKCALCFVDFKFKRMLDLHMKNFHDENKGKYSCELCNTYYDLSRKLVQHVNAKHVVVFRCNMCNVVSHSLDIAERHYNYHKGIKKQCELCKEQFNWLGVYYNHLVDKHGCNFVCTYCALTFPTEKKLEEHKSKHKTKAAKSDSSSGVKCEHCGLIFISQKICDRHMRIKHREKSWYESCVRQSRNKVNIEADAEPPGLYTCDHCGRTFTYKKQIIRHINMLNGTRRKSTMPRRPIQCRVCNFNTTCAYYLSNHFKTAHPDLHMDTVYADKRKYMCDHCGNRYAHKFVLKNHLKNHFDETPFACNVCPKKLKTEAQLLRHQLLHLPKGEECKVCGKMFRSPSNLFSHMRTHIQNRKFKCETCGKGFLHAAALREHIRGVHFNIRRVKKTKPKIDKAKADSNDASNKTKKTYDDKENDVTDTEKVTTEPGHVFNDTENYLSDTEHNLIETFKYFTKTGTVITEIGNDTATGTLAPDTGSKTKKTSKRVLPVRTKIYAKSAKRRRKLSTDTDDSD